MVMSGKKNEKWHTTTTVILKTINYFFSGTVTLVASMMSAKAGIGILDCDVDGNSSH